MQSEPRSATECGHGRTYTELRRQMVTVGVPCCTAMWVRPVSTPITARQAASASTASGGVAATSVATPMPSKGVGPVPLVTWATS